MELRCRNCNSPITQPSNFCSKCGSGIGVITADQIHRDTVFQRASNSSSDSIKIIAIIIGIAVGLFAGAALGYGLGPESDNSHRKPSLTKVITNRYYDTSFREYRKYSIENDIGRAIHDTRNLMTWIGIGGSIIGGFVASRLYRK